MRMFLYFVVLLLPLAIGFVIGRATSPRLPKADRERLAALEGERADVVKIAMDGLTTDPSAMFVLDRINKTTTDLATRNRK